MNYSKRRLGTLTLCLAPLWLALAGCGSGFITPDNPDAVQERESNDTFSSAQAVTMPDGQSLQINGTFQGGNDVDVYSLGTFQAGQTFSAVLTGDSGVTPSYVQFGFFDQDQEVAILDDNAITAADQKVAFTVCKPGKYYLGLAQSGQSSFITYAYSVQVTLGSSTVPDPLKQIFYLNFNGVSSVTIWDTTFTNVKPFSAINNGFSPQVIAAQTVDAIRADYALYNVQVLSSYDTLEPAGEHATVFVSGGNNEGFFGLSDHIDWYNQDLDDHAIIFAGALNGYGLTQNQFVAALANIVSHEMGHLCGLAHTVDHTELMDISTPMRYLDQDQDFHVAALAEFPIGTEDPLELLQFSLGLL
jgi:hypothetical protein